MIERVARAAIERTIARMIEAAGPIEGVAAAREGDAVGLRGAGIALRRFADPALLTLAADAARRT